MEPIIKSFFDTDFYTQPMGQFVYNQFPQIEVEYQFVNRGGTQFPAGFSFRVSEQLRAMERLIPEDEILEFLAQTCGHFLKDHYLESLRYFRFNSKDVEVTQKDSCLWVKIKGLWRKTIFWEIPIMAIISELYFRETGQEPTIDYKTVSSCKAKSLQEMGAIWTDFGTRRRYSAQVHEEVLVEALKFKFDGKSGLVGTSNPFLAYKYRETGIKLIGTMAHQLFSVLGAVYGYQIANKIVMETWLDEFDGHLGIALSDTLTTEVFLRDFGRKLAMQFDGVREDSSPHPLQFANTIIDHYRDLRIDPTTKTIVHSNGIDSLDLAWELINHRVGEYKRSLGIGTWFTNDCGVKPLNIVIKAVGAKRPNHPWQNAIKLSDTPGKATGDPETIEYVRRQLGV